MRLNEIQLSNLFDGLQSENLELRKRLLGNFYFTSLDDMKLERNRRLTACDWIVLDDSPASLTCKTNYETYRQLLRDLPNGEGFDYTNFEWPSEPAYEKA